MRPKRDSSNENSPTILFPSTAQTIPAKTSPKPSGTSVKRCVKKSEYFTAKQKAARQIVRGWVKPADLPSNAEIREEILAMARLYEGDRQSTNLQRIRITALRMMRILSRFRPTLIGSVMTGHVRQGSDIDLHVFSDNISAITMALDEILVPYDVERKCVRKDGKERIFTHSACYVVGISVTELHVQKRLAPRGEN